jgi:hypothetical protein
MSVMAETWLTFGCCLMNSAKASTRARKAGSVTPFSSPEGTE